jgi:NitT/TauT family transport system ATP-binding protein
VEFVSVRKRFGGDAAVEDISLSVAPGEFLVLVGPSGCGKSTLLNMLAGMLRPDAGTITVNGRPITAPGPDRAVVFQDHALFPWLTAAQNVSFGLRMAGVGRAERQDRVEAALRKVHLLPSARKLVHELSGGMRQRIAIARALVMDPDVLLMDEPFAALDAQTRTLMHEQLQELWGDARKTIVFVTHSVGEAVRLADRIVVLHAHPGRIRKIIRVPLPHPRHFDGPEVTELVHHVRTEIEDEVKRVNAKLAEFWKPQGAAGVGAATFSMGDGI